MSDTRGLNFDNLAAGITAASDLNAINARLGKCGLPAVTDPSVGALQLARASGIKSQGDAAVLIINLTNGKVDPSVLTKILADAFVGSKVGARHGPHYLSLARTGKLKGVEIDGAIAHRSRKVKAQVMVVTQAAPVAASVEAAEAADTAELLAAIEAADAEVAGTEVADPAPEAVVVDAAAALRAELEALSQKQLMARAKSAGVKCVGVKKENIIAAIVAVS